MGLRLTSSRLPYPLHWLPGLARIRDGGSGEAEGSNATNRQRVRGPVQPPAAIRLAPHIFLLSSILRALI